jgi:glycogen debranching enzyme
MTIWDAADRRDHAVDLQVLGVEAERSYAELAELVGDPARAPAARARAETLAGRIRERYAWPEEQFLFDSLRADGSPVRRIRPNALLAIPAGILPPAEARALVDRALRPDLRTPWGLRTLATGDPLYDPRSYHEGQVWPIATAWAAHAAFLVGRREVGVELLTTLARSYLAEGGLANECYRGDAPEPWNSCCLLGFSVAPFLTTLFEGLWGITPDLARGRVRVEPRFPAGWTKASLDQVRLGAGALSLRWRAGTLTAAWTGGAPLEVVGPDASVVVPAGGEMRVERPVGES